MLRGRPTCFAATPRCVRPSSRTRAPPPHALARSPLPPLARSARRPPTRSRSRSLAYSLCAEHSASRRSAGLTAATRASSVRTSSQIHVGQSSLVLSNLWCDARTARGIASRAKSARARVTESGGAGEAAEEEEARARTTLGAAPRFVLLPVPASVLIARRSAVDVAAQLDAKAASAAAPLDADADVAASLAKLQGRLLAGVSSLWSR